MTKRISHESAKSRLLKKPEIKKAYEAVDIELELLETMLKARTHAGLTQSEVAAIMGTTTSVVGRIETGGGSKGHSPTLATLQRYARALGYHLKINFIQDKHR